MIGTFTRIDTPCFVNMYDNLGGFIGSTSAVGTEIQGGYGFRIIYPPPTLPTQSYAAMVIIGNGSHTSTVYEGQRAASQITWIPL